MHIFAVIFLCSIHNRVVIGPKIKEKHTYSGRKVGNMEYNLHAWTPAMLQQTNMETRSIRISFPILLALSTLAQNDQKKKQQSLLRCACKLHQNASRKWRLLHVSNTGSIRDYPAH